MITGEDTGLDTEPAAREESQAVLSEGELQQILSRARAWLGALSRPKKSVTIDLKLNELKETDEVDWAESFEEGVRSVERAQEFGAPVLLVLDQSFSTEGKANRIIAEALALFLYQFHADQLGVLAFSRTPVWLKAVGEALTPAEVLRRFLKMEPGGYTHIESAARKALNVQQRFPNLRVVLLTDGKRTAGRDPVGLLAQLRSLWLIQPGREPGSDLSLRDWVERTNAKLRVAATISDVPRVTLDAVREILRGKP